MTSFSKSANACGEQSEGESMDEVTIALSCRDKSANHGTVARIVATIRIILSLSQEEETDSRGPRTISATAKKPPCSRMAAFRFIRSLYQTNPTPTPVNSVSAGIAVSISPPALFLQFGPGQRALFDFL
jgi:hypothetical protein